MTKIDNSNSANLKKVGKIRQFFTDPSDSMQRWRLFRLNLMRKLLSSENPNLPINDMLFDNRAEPENIPADREQIAKRLYAQRIALNVLARTEFKTDIKGLLLNLKTVLLLFLLFFASSAFHVFLVIEKGYVINYLALASGILLLAWAGYSAIATNILGSIKQLKKYLPRPIFTESDIQESAEFAERVLVRAHTNDTPDDLKDRFRDLNIDATGEPVDGQVVGSDLHESYAKKLIAKIYAFNNERLLAAAFFAFSLIAMSFSTFLGFAALLANLAFVLVALADPVSRIMLRFVLRGDTSEMRGALAQRARVESPAQRLIEEFGKEPFVLAEQARLDQLVNATNDKSTFLELGKSTGTFFSKGDLFAPSEPDMAFGMSANDLSTHLLVLGDTGTGKTSGVLRPLLKSWSHSDQGGIVVLDGKGSLPAEVADLPNFRLISPENDSFNPIENLTPDEIADTFFEMFGEGEDDIWPKAATKKIRAAAIIMQSINMLYPARMAFNIQSLYQIAADPTGWIDAAKLIHPDEVDNLPAYARRAFYYLFTEFQAMPGDTAGSINMNVSTWISSITDNELLNEWANTESGAQIEDALKGSRLGLLLPEAKFGETGTLISNFAKKRLFRAIKQRADVDWQKDGHSVLLLADEAQALITEDDQRVLPIARSLGLSVVYATQNIDGIIDRISGNGASTAAAEQLLGSLRSLISLSVSTKATKEFVSSRMGSSYRAHYERIDAPHTHVGANLRLSSAVGGGFGKGTELWRASRVSETITRARELTGAGAATARVVESLGKMSGISTLARKLGKQVSMNVNFDIRAIVTAEEITPLTAAPNFALACVQRGRVERRDVIKLNPVYNFEGAENEKL